MSDRTFLDRCPRRIRLFIQFWQYYFPCDRILAQRIFKSTVNSTVAFVFTLIPKVRAHLGTEPAMLPLISVMVHPGRRVSGTIQGAIYCITGLIFGLAYSIFGRFLAQECLGPSWRHLTEVQQYEQNFKRFEAGLAIMAVFETLMLFFHGWMRSVSHHYFGIVFPLFLVTHFALMASLTESPGVIANSFATPFYLGIAMSIFWNLVLFPEFGSTYLGTATINAFNEIHKDIDNAVNFFVSINSAPPPSSDEKDSEGSTVSNDSSMLPKSLYAKPISTLSKLLKSKTAMSKHLSNCEAVLQECIYEISYSYVGPQSLENPISIFKNLAIFANGIINACQLEFILMGRSENIGDVALDISPDKEIAYGDSSKLLNVLETLREPIHNLHKTLSETMYKINVTLAYAYDVKVTETYYPEVFYNLGIKKMNKKHDIPADFNFDENIALLEDAVAKFSEVFREQLLKFDKDAINPSDEMFVLSSFLMNFRESTTAIASVAREIQEIYEYRKNQEKKGWIRGKKIWFNFMSSFSSFKEWLIGNSLDVTEGEALNGVIHGYSYEQQPELVSRRPNIEEDDLLKQRKKATHTAEQAKNEMILPTSNRESPEPSQIRKSGDIFNISLQSQRFMRWCNNFYKKYKAHFRFGTQVAVALQLASFPMFVPRLRHWYINYRGTWIGFVCILCLEPSVGGTFWVFFLRAVGVALGALWGLVSYYSGQNQSNPYLETVITLFGSVPGFYFLLGTPYVKAAIIHIISIYIVILAAVLPSTIPSAIPVSFGKRCLAVGYGGTIALIVQVIIFPIKARDQLNEEISFVCGCISEMVSLYASALEGEELTVVLPEVTYHKIVRISKSAKEALARAQAYNGLTRQEPRLKGEFTELEKIFSQVIFIQRQIIERLDTASLLRKTYGSAVIEEMNYVMYPYRRQMIGSITSLMREMQEAFINKTPLPQFSPSARIAHRRLVNKVRSTLEIKHTSKSNSRSISRLNSRRLGQFEMSPVTVPEGSNENSDEEEEEVMIKPTFRKKLLQHKARDEGEYPELNDISHKEVIQQDYYIREKFLSWNASSAALEEIIEYIEELLSLTKILVGVNEFKYGFLSRPLYEDWATEAITGFDDFINGRKKPEFNENVMNVVSTQSTDSVAPDEIVDDVISNGNTNSNTENSSLASSRSSLSVESLNGPVAFNGEGTRQNRRPSVNLAKIASHKINQGDTVPSNFRDRLNSLASGALFQEGLSALNREKTLGDADSAFGDADTDDSDEDLPLALKMVMSHMRKRD